MTTKYMREDTQQTVLAEDLAAFIALQSDWADLNTFGSWYLIERTANGAVEVVTVVRAIPDGYGNDGRISVATDV